MQKRLEVEVQHLDEATLVTMRGIINEDNNLKDIAQQIAAERVIINTAQVELINSLGVRDWIRWIAALEERGIKCYFVECSPTILTQANLVINFIGRGQILSFNAPYFCPSCCSDQPTLLRVDELRRERPVEVPARRCINCDHMLEFMERESFFFSFLSWVGDGKIEPEVERALKAASEPSPSDVPPQKTLDDLLPETVSSPLPLRVEIPAPAQRIPRVMWVVVGVMAAAIGILVYIVLKRG